jgi:hypothetical protein
MPSTGRPAADVIETGKLREAGAADRLVCRSTVVVDLACDAAAFARGGTLCSPSSSGRKGQRPESLSSSGRRTSVEPRTSIPASGNASCATSRGAIRRSGDRRHPGGRRDREPVCRWVRRRCPRHTERGRRPARRRLARPRPARGCPSEQREHRPRPHGELELRLVRLHSRRLFDCGLAAWLAG